MKKQTQQKNETLQQKRLRLLKTTRNKVAVKLAPNKLLLQSSSVAKPLRHLCERYTSPSPGH